MEQILLVEDSRSLGTLVKTRIEKSLGIKVVWLQNFAETVRVVSSQKEEFCLGILDLTLPDAPHGEVVDFVLARNIPVIIFAGELSDELRQAFWSKMIVDYVLKDSPATMDYLVGLVERLFKNRFIDVLVVDDSPASSLEICNHLTVHKYNVFYAANGPDALAILAENPHIKLAMIDHFMPGMDGVQLVSEIRQRYSKDQMAIVGISGRLPGDLPARFLKHGANDFIRKPFVREEFYCRITQNIELIEYIDTIKNRSNTDYLTGLYNRRYFQELGRKLFASVQRGHITLTVAMIDIDGFKQINDTYGHHAGDLVLKQLALLLMNRFRATDIVCRYGGEEFCIVATNMASEYVFAVFDELRDAIAHAPFDLGFTSIHLTVSMGICSSPAATLEEMIQEADTNLYAAKESGRNKVIV